MKKMKIGLIDYFLDQYHADNYPKWIKKASDGQLEVTCAYAKTDKPGGKTNAAFCREQGITLLPDIASVIDRSDCLIVMSPDNPEMHEELCRLPLGSGKPTYVDKAFAPDSAAAARLIAVAQGSGTPFFSSSALRFAKEYTALERNGIESVHSRGPGSFDNYGIHQIEPIVSLLGHDVRKIMYIGTKNTPAFVMRFRDGRCAAMSQLGWECGFGMAVNYDDGHAALPQAESDFYAQFILKMVEFFKDGIPKVAAQETLGVITILEYGKKAMQTPDIWIDIPKSPV